MENNFALDYLVMYNNGVDAFDAVAGFMSKGEAIAYAEKRAGEREPFNPEDTVNACNSARVAQYEVILVLDGNCDEWETKHVTKSFYKD